MDKKTETFMMAPEGIKALWDRLEQIQKQMDCLTNWLAQMSVDLSKQEQLTTVEPTQTVPTPDNQWDAEEYTNLGMNPSSQSDPVDTKSGPVEPSFALGDWSLRQMDYQGQRVPQRIVLEKTDGQLEWYARIPAQDVDQTSSTSAKQPLSEYVENSVEESALFQSKDYPNEEQLKWLDKGGQIALTTLKEFIEGRLRIKRTDFQEY